MKKTLIVEKSILNGKIQLSGAKNSGLRLQAASILTDDELILTNFPTGLSDAMLHNKMLEVLGKKVNIKNNTLTLSGSVTQSELIWEERSIRNTLLILGATTAKTGFSKVPLPGGCTIGERKYDLHIDVLESLGAKVWEEGNYLCAKVDGKLQANNIHLSMRSTGATENAIMCASLANGITTIWNPHIRPEILDLIQMLNKMGAKILVRGNESIVVEGVDSLHGTTHRVIPDNMEALTFLIAAAVTGGEIEIEDFPLNDLEVPMIFLKESGVRVFEGKNSLITRGSMCYPLEIATGPYPGINSDMQPLLAVYGSMAKGMSTIVDLRFPDRFGYATQLNKMGVDIEVVKNQLVINGGNKLHGVEVFADDLRAGAALLLAGMVAEGTTVIQNAQQIERGYENFLEKFQSLGANIHWRVEE